MVYSLDYLHPVSASIRSSKGQPVVIDELQSHLRSRYHQPSIFLKCNQPPSSVIVFNLRFAPQKHYSCSRFGQSPLGKQSHRSTREMHRTAVIRPFLVGDSDGLRNLRPSKKSFVISAKRNYIPQPSREITLGIGVQQE